MNLFKNYKRTLTKILLGFGAFLLIYIIAEVILAKVFLKNIETGINSTLNEKINGDASISHCGISIFDNFPNVSITIKNLNISGPNYPITKVAILKADEINLQIKILQLIQGKIAFSKISIKNSEINISRLQSGLMSTNNLFVKQDNDTDSASTITIPISNIALNNVRLIIEDTVIADSKFDLTFSRSAVHISPSAKGYQFETADNIFVKTLAFRTERGGCFENTALKSYLNLEWNTETKDITLMPSTLKVRDSYIYAKGTIKSDVFPQVALFFTAAKVNMSDAVDLVSNYTREKLKGYNFTKPLNATLTLSGEMIPNIPLNLDLFFRTSDNKFTTTKQSFEAVALNGHYTNHLSPLLLKDEINSGLTLVGFKGKFETIPFDINLHVANLLDPYLSMHLRSNINLKEVNNAVDTGLIQFNAGTINLDVTYKGYTSLDHVKSAVDSGATLIGFADIKNAGYVITKQNYKFSNITGKIEFDGRNIFFNELPVTINSNATSISASFSNFTNSMMRRNEKMKADIAITCQQFDLTNFTAPTESATKPDDKKHLNRLIENLIANIDANITLKAKQVVRNKLILNDVSANLNMRNDDIYCRQANFSAADGKIDLSGSLTNMGTSKTAFQLTSHIFNADINKLFAALNNFNQTAVTAKNISGKLDANIAIGAGLTNTFTIKQETLKGTLQAKIKQGAIHNLKALDEITANILKKKDFSSMQFATLNHNSTLNGKDFTIEQMEIQSNVITVFVNGVYSMGDNTELFVKVPISSLKNQDPDYVAKNKSPDDKIGLSLNFKVKKVDGDMKVTPVLFNRNKANKPE